MPKVFNYQILNKQILLFTGFGGNNIAKCINIQIIVNTLILKLEKHETIILLIFY